MKCRHFWLTGATALSITLAGNSLAWAEPAPEPSQVEVKAARQLFAEAERDESVGRWREALDKFSRVVAFKATPSGLFHKAYCEEKVGLLLAAYQDYKRAAQLNESYPATSVENKKLIDGQTTSRLVALLPRIPSLKVRAPAGVAGMRVLFDDVELKADELNVSRQVELGQHLVEATAQGRPPYRSTITLTEGSNEALTITFAEPVASPASEPIARAVPSDERPASSSTRTVVIWAGAGASAALAATGMVFFLKARSAADNLERECSRTDALCQRDELESARNRNYLAAGITGGLAAVGVGVTVWLARAGNAKAALPRQSFVLSPGGGMVRMAF